MPRFFVPRAELGENFLVLTGENAAHARVLRLKNGDAVTVCDGEGEEWHCVVSDVAPGQVSLVVQEHTAAKSEAAVFCSVYMAFAKADKFEHVIQKATELGAAELVAFPSARCVSRPDERSLEEQIELITDAESANNFIAQIDNFEHVGSSKQMAAKLVANKAKSLNLKLNSEKKYEPAA